MNVWTSHFGFFIFPSPLEFSSDGMKQVFKPRASVLAGRAEVARGHPHERHRRFVGTINGYLLLFGQLLVSSKNKPANAAKGFLGKKSLVFQDGHGHLHLCGTGILRPAFSVVKVG